MGFWGIYYVIGHFTEALWGGKGETRMGTVDPLIQDMP